MRSALRSLAALAASALVSAPARGGETLGDAQIGIVEALVKKDDRRGAVSAARTVLDASSDRNEYVRNCRWMAEMIRNMDGNVARANRFIEYQIYGPDGKDGRPRTSDDVKDPLDEFKYPSYPERERVLKETLRDAGDSAWASRDRARVLIYTGRPDEAVRYYVDAFRRSPCKDRDVRWLASEMVWSGLRSVRGHASGIEDVLAFVAYGPAGPDGRPGTQDDLKDPFAPLLGATRAADGKGGLASLTGDDVAVLRDLAARMEKLAANPNAENYERREAVWALDRAHEALSDWGRGEVLDWYLGRMSGEQDEEVQEGLVAGGLRAAMGGDYHFGARGGYWQRIESQARSTGGLKGRAQRVRAESERWVRDIVSRRRPLEQELWLLR